MTLKNFAGKLVNKIRAAFDGTPLPANTSTGAPRTQMLSVHNPILGASWKDTAQKSYKAYWDSAHARSVVNSLRNFTVNSGLRLQAMPSTTILGANEEQLREWVARVESSWRIWSNSKDADYAYQNSLNQLQGLAVTSMIVWGEYFAVLRWDSKRQRINPLSVQLIHPAQVAQPAGNFIEAARSRGNIVKEGIEISQTGEEVAVYVKTKKPDGQTETNRIAAYSEKTKKQILVHGYVSMEPGQYRGMPFLAPVLHELAKCSDMTIFELESAVINASMAGVVTVDKDATAGQAPFGTFGAPKGQTDSAPSQQTVSGYDDLVLREVKHGGIINQGLPPGYKYDGIDTRRPNVNVPEFIDRLLTYISSAVGIPIELVKMQFGQNYSASKGSIELGFRIFENLNQEFANDFLNPIYSAWLEGEIAAGLVAAPGWEIPRIRAAWTFARWNGLPIPSLNPAVETRAAETRVMNGFSTREYEAQKLTGTTFAENVARLKDENTKLISSIQMFPEYQQQELPF